MLSLAFLAAAALAPAQTSESASPPIRFIGQSTGESPGVRDQAFGEVQRFAGQSLRCPSAPEEIRVTVHPAGWVPADPNFRIGPAGSIYERWDVTMCGRVEPFLIVFWREGTRSEFQVGHPYPAPPAPAAR